MVPVWDAIDYLQLCMLWEVKMLVSWRKLQAEENSLNSGFQKISMALR